MQLEIKSLQRIEMKRILDKKFKMLDVSDNCFDGVVGLLTFNDISEPLYVPSPINSNLCIADKNYKWLQFAPKNSNWWLTIMFDENNDLIESYFDITRENYFNNDNPYFADMKLDVIVSPNKEAIIIDRDELDDALLEGIITKEEHQLAITTANEIAKNYNNNKELFYDYINTYFEILNNA